MSVEWAASRGVAPALVGLGVGAAVSVHLSAMPAGVAWPVSIAVLMLGLLEARALVRVPTAAVTFLADGRVRHGDLELEDPRLHWQGPITVLSWRDGRARRRLLGWPDTVDSGIRRELRLWARQRHAAPHAAAVAP